VSKYQIIGGGNCFPLPLSCNFTVCRKTNVPENFSMAMRACAWTNTEGNAKERTANVQEPGRIHPAQKPMALYKKLLQWYSKPEDKILNTHLGAGGIALARIDSGCDLTRCETGREYCEKAAGRIGNILDLLL
jgi:site-specific DNA-methyltransferase (adenine-specific)